jgi:diadenosine tetraphosphate (Ap4A) HIT family hydrolase
MSESEMSDCLVCRKHRGIIKLFGGVIYENEYIFISHAIFWKEEKEHYLGHIFIETRRHVAEWADLTETESKMIGLFTQRISKALLSTEKMEHVYAFYIGDGVPHFHIHIIGRYPEAPREYWGIKVDEWPQAPKGGEDEITGVTNRVRKYLQENYPK